MSTETIYTCDRCGVEQRGIGGFYRIQYVETLMSTAHDAHKYADLCKTCMAAFYEFMERFEEAP